MRPFRQNESVRLVLHCLAVCVVIVFPWTATHGLGQNVGSEELLAPPSPRLFDSAPPAHQAFKPGEHPRVTDITLQSADVSGGLPRDDSGGLFQESLEPDPRQTRGWAATDYLWAPTKIAYNPLYFEQVAAERYGQTLCPCAQPALSLGCFWGDLISLPGQMVLDCPWSCEYPYGYYPAGSPAPCRLP